MRRTIAHDAAGARFVIVIVDFDLGKIGLNFSIARASIHPESRFLRQPELRVAIAVIDLHVADAPHAHFDRPVIVLQANIARDVIQLDVFRTRDQMHRAGNRIGAQIVGVEVEGAVDSLKFHICA